MSIHNETRSMKETAQTALQANKDHQYALKVYTERLEAELKTIDKLLDTADIDEDDDEPDLNAGGSVFVPNSVKAVFPIFPNEFLSENSPFRDDALKRTRYLNYTATHPMKNKELEALAEAVRTENHRKRALDAQKGGLPSFATRDDKAHDFFEWNTEGIDWDRVAEKVSSVAPVPRTAQDCAIRWLGHRHPRFVHSSWSASELEKLQTLIKDAPPGQLDWVEISNSLGTNRTPLDCMRHGIHRKQVLWTPHTDDALMKAIDTYGTDNWLIVARHVSEDATAQQCQQRYSRTLDPNIKRGAWTEDEDARLRLAVTVHGNSWIEIAEVIHGRTNEQCRDRWSDKLNPTLMKGRWTNEEDRCLVEAVESLGTTSWKEISERLGTGRTDNNCRSRYDKLLQKKTKPKPKGSNNLSLAVASQPATPDLGNAQSPDSNIPSDQEAGPSRPRPRPRKTVTSQPAVTSEIVETSAERVRPRPRPRAKKSQGIEQEQYSSASTPIGEEPTPAGTPEPNTELSTANKGKGKSKNIAAPRKLNTTRKRRGHSTETLEAPTKRQKLSITIGENATAHGAGNVNDVDSIDHQSDLARIGLIPLNENAASAPEQTMLSQSQAGVEGSLSDGPTGVVNKTPKSNIHVKRVVAAEPTRRQPSRNASKRQ